MRIHVDKLTEEQLGALVAQKLEELDRRYYKTKKSNLTPTELLALGKYKPYMYDSQAAELIRKFKLWIVPLADPNAPGRTRGWEAGLLGKDNGYFSYDPNKPWRAICKAVVAGPDGFVEFR